MLTNSELNQIKNFLALHGKKDSQLSPVTTIGDTDYVSIVQGSKNVTITMELLRQAIFQKIIDVDILDIIDNTPTENSRKLVRSGGVYDAINNPKVIHEHQMDDDAISTRTIQDNAISTSKIANKNVTEDKLSDEIKSSISKYTHVLKITGDTLREIDTKANLTSTFATTHQTAFYGDRAPIVVTPDFQETTSNIEQDTIEGNTWTLAPIVGTHILTHRSEYNGIVPTNATKSINLNLAKFIGYVPDDVISQGNETILNYLISNIDSVITKDFSDSVACTIDIKANGTGKKYAYFAVPDGMSITLVTQTASQLQFNLEAPVIVNRTIVFVDRTIGSSAYAYKLYKSVEKPDSDRAKNVKIS